MLKCNHETQQQQNYYCYCYCYCYCHYYYYYYYYCFMAPWTVSRTTLVNWYQKGKTRKVKPIWIYWSKRQWVAVASAGDVFANLHLAPDNHASIPPLSFLQARCPSCRPTNSVKALKAPALKVHSSSNRTEGRNGSVQWETQFNLQLQNKNSAQ